VQENQRDILLPRDILLIMSREDPPSFDVIRGHRFFSAECYNRTWELIEKSDRTGGDDEAMVLSTLASLWHWMQRPDCTEQKLSIGHWQVSRVYALVGRGDDAMRHAQRSLAFSTGAEPFYVGYAHESIARAASVLADQPTRQFHLRQAWECAASVADVSERTALEQDLRSLADGCGPEA
jgi:hypothetical protein